MIAVEATTAAPAVTIRMIFIWSFPV